MLVPASLYGESMVVKQRMQRMAKALLRGKSFDEAMKTDDLIDTAQHPGPFLIEPSRGLKRQPYYAFYWPLACVLRANERLPDELREEFFHHCLESPWGLALLLPQSLTMFFWSKHRWPAFLEAASRFWPVLAAEGARYVSTLSEPRRLDQIVSSINYVVGNAGLPRPPAGGPFPPDWPERLHQYAILARQRFIN